MADAFVITDTTYAGEAAQQFIMPAITGADTIDGGNCYVKDGIKKKFTIPRWDSDYSTLIQARQATPTSQGTMTVSGQHLTVEDYMIYMEFNPRDFETHWYSQEMLPALIDAQLPYNANSVVVMGVMQRHAKYFNKQIWNGNTTTTGIYSFFDGWIKKLSDSTDTVKVPTPVTLTESNVAAEFLRGYNLIPLALRYDVNMKYFVSYATYDLYNTYQVNQPYKGIDVTRLGVPEFRGKKVEKIADFPDNTYVIAKGLATTESNLWVGINSFTDEGLKFSPLQSNSELWFVKLLMKADVQVGWFNEAVYYGPVI
jgi:hypothetical protein